MLLLRELWNALYFVEVKKWKMLHLTISTLVDLYSGLNSISEHFIISMSTKSKISNGLKITDREVSMQDKAYQWVTEKSSLQNT